MRCLYYFCSFLIWLILSANTIVLSQNEDKRIRLEKADEATSEIQDGHLVRTAKGNVFLRQGTTELRCDEWNVFPNQNKMTFTGRVHIKDVGYDLRAKEVHYFSEKKLFQAKQDVIFISDSTRMDAHQLHYFQKEKRVVAEDSVVIFNEKERVRITGKRVEHLRETGYSKVTGEPVLTQFDSLGQVDMRIWGQVMEVFDSGKRFEVSENVRIVRGETSATCEKAIYVSDDENIALKIEPQAAHQSNKIKGEEIFLKLNARKLQEIEVVGKAKFTSPPDSAAGDVEEENYLTGQQINVHFENDEVRRVKVAGTATSVYHIVNEKGVYQGENWAQGDTITIYLKDSAVRNIKVISNPGNSLGKFTPPKEDSTKTDTAAQNNAEE